MKTVIIGSATNATKEADLLITVVRRVRQEQIAIVARVILTLSFTLTLKEHALVSVPTVSGEILRPILANLATAVYLNLTAVRHARQQEAVAVTLAAPLTSCIRIQEANA
jgi:hypothetical protein